MSFVPLQSLRRAELATAPPAAIDLAIGDMHCAACVSRVEQALGNVLDVSAVAVNLATGRAHVTATTAVSVDDLVRAVRAAGYTARPLSAAAEAEEAGARVRSTADLRRRLAVAATLGVPVVALAHLGMLPPLASIPLELQNAIQWVAATPVMFWAGGPFLRGAARGLRHRAADMNLLIALGTLAAYLYSTAVTVAPGAFRAVGMAPHAYFDTTVVILAMILLGRWLEARARAGVGRAIRRLLDLAPKRARRVDGGGVAEEVSLDEVRAGDVLEVRPGDVVPVDGEVLEGGSHVDASMWTGEPLPRAVGPGDRVAGGAVNQRGAFRMRAEAVGRDTALARVALLVEQAQVRKADVARLADRVAGVFVPVVLAVAIATFVLWYDLGPEPRVVHALLRAVSVLILACPCALGLATPTALLAGTGRGAELGVLLRGADALEAADRIDVVVFDKTGTLTHGRPRLVAVVPAPGADPGELWAVAAGLEARSEHPLAAPIVDGARERGIAPATITGFAAVPGQGVLGLVEGEVAAVGTPAFLAAHGIVVPDLADANVGAAGGHTVVWIGRAGRPLGALVLGDTLKAQAAEVVRALGREGCSVWMVTGDTRRTAVAIAAQAGIPESQVVAGVLPEEKNARVRALQAQGRRVAMVGDGVNDAPALAEADLGIAMGGGTDIARESSGITLLRTDLDGVRVALRLARRTMAVIRQNLFWAFAYNVIGIPVAAGLLYVLLRPGGPVGPLFGWDGTLHPMLASLAMALSSVTVITSSLRLRGYRP